MFTPTMIIHRLVVVSDKKFVYDEQFFAGVNIAFFKFSDKQLIRTNKPANRIFERKEAAFQTLDKQNFHKLAHVLLGLFLQLV